MSKTPLYLLLPDGRKRDKIPFTVLCLFPSPCWPTLWFYWPDFVWKVENLLFPVSVQLSLLASLGQEDHPFSGWGGEKSETVRGSLPPVHLSCVQSMGLAASLSAFSAITAVSKQLLRFMLRLYGALRFDRYILQGYQGFKTGMTHSCDGRRPVIMLIYAIWRKLPVLLLKCSPLWSVLHPHPYLNGSQIKLNASQTNSFHPSLFILMLSSLLMLVRSMLSKWSHNLQITT